MNGYGYGYSVWINANEGKGFICTLDSVCILDEHNEVFAH